MGHKCMKNLWLPQKVLFNKQIKSLFVLVANGDVSLLANDDAVVGHGGDLSPVHQIGAMHTHESVSRQPFLQGFHTEEGHDGLVVVEVDPDVFALTLHVENLVDVDSEHLIICFYEQIPLLILSQLTFFCGWTDFRFRQSQLLGGSVGGA